jgi:hypothetical protein
VRNVNEMQLGPLLRRGIETPQIRGITYQPATWSGRYGAAQNPLDRVTLADVVRLIAAQSNGVLAEGDFQPLPCGDPNCCSYTFVARRRPGAFENNIRPYPGLLLNLRYDLVLAGNQDPVCSQGTGDLRPERRNLHGIDLLGSRFLCHRQT